MPSTMMSRTESRMVETPRIRTHLLTTGPDDGEPVIFVHGNVSSAIFWEDSLDALPVRFRGLAPDLRGYGDTEALPVDGTRGMSDFADDLHSLIETLGLTANGGKVHLIGWSMGGGVILQYATDHPEAVASLTLVCAMSPYGFGGTKDAAGTLCWSDYAGSGGGLANPDFVQRLGEGDAGSESPNSPRNVMNAFYFKPPFRVSPEQEERFVTSMLKTKTGPDFYPGDAVPSENWPGVGPGTRGFNNAFSPRYFNVSHFAKIQPQPPVLWIRGADDQIVSDTSFFDMGFLGQLGYVPGWPGAEVVPPQPMVSQLRALLDDYAGAGGRYHEEVFADCGHSPHVEQAERFQSLLFGFLDDPQQPVQG